MQRPRNQRDIEAIKQLKYRYLRTLDLKQWDEFAECFVPEATGDYDGLVFEDRDVVGRATCARTSARA